MDYFILNLDTTEPEVEINSPVYTTPNIVTEITIQSNEKLSSYQDIYIVDSEGNTHILDCLYQGDHFVYKGYLNQLSFGMAVIYAQLKDEVENKSALVSKSINIMESNVFTLDKNVSVPSLSLRKESMDINTVSKKLGILIPSVISFKGFSKVKANTLDVKATVKGVENDER